MQIPKINRCSSGLTIIIPNYWKEQNHLLLKAVSNWVEKTAEGMENNQKRFLRIRFGYIYRVRQMFSTLKKWFSIPRIIFKINNESGRERANYI